MATKVKQKWEAVPPPGDCTNPQGHKIATEFLPKQDIPYLVVCVYCNDTGNIIFLADND